MNEIMSHDGGIREYTFSQNRHATEEKPYGRKVYFLNKNGYSSDLEEARELFKVGQVLTVKEIYVGQSRSNVEFVEFPEMRFNTVMFADYQE